MAASPTGAIVLASALLALLAPPVSAQVEHRTHGPDPAPAAGPVATASAAPNWCPNTDPGANQLDNGPYRYRAIYAHPSDRGSRLASIGGQLQAGAFGASALLEREYGRAIRFDVGTPCGPGQLDIVSVRLPFSAAQLSAFASAGGVATFNAVTAALQASGFAVASNDASVEQLAGLTENFLVWLDGPGPARSCGQGTALLDSTRSETNLNNLGGKLAIVFRNGNGFCGADTVRHEIGHNLGALQPDAPNTTDGVHCNDAFEDTMCGVDSPVRASGAFNGLYFDFGHNDYWDPPRGRPLGWWTVNLNRFLCPDAGCNRPAAASPQPAAQGTPPQVIGAETPRRAKPAAERRKPRRYRAARPRLRVKSVRRGARYVRLRYLARGKGSARIVVRCPGRSGNRRVGAKRISLPSVVRVRTTCRSPRAKLTRWHRPRAAHFFGG